ncbi:MAG: hypothetical protein FVQ84_16065 [Planctomycetes bacterium]|nr:hypothetical protein [Planctomycetota bacterium]
MEFYLKYDGPLKSNAGAKDKHNIREYFHPQMKKLWDIEPLKSCKEAFLTSGGELSVLKEVDGVVFAPLVSSVLKFICKFDITMLWPEKPGVISKCGGDIDNRLKTLFDALQCPDVNQIKPIKESFKDKKPFFCLLENDKLITSVNINTHTLLRPGNKTDVSVLIHVVIKATELMWDTIGLSG